VRILSLVDAQEVARPRRREPIPRRTFVLHSELFTETEEHASDPETHGNEFAGSETDTYYVVVSGNDHMAFTDARLLQWRFSTEPAPSAARCEKALGEAELTQSLVNEFVGKYLGDRLAPERHSLVRIDRLGHQ
jgi:hypothetical protein